MWYATVGKEVLPLEGGAVNGKQKGVACVFASKTLLPIMAKSCRFVAFRLMFYSSRRGRH
jgi:hypothetical protein